MGLVERVKKLTTSKPNLTHIESIKGTTLVEGNGKGGIAIYDSETNKVLFGGANPDLWYIGRLDRTHIARKQEKISENWKTYFVDEKGNILFGRKYDSESLTLVDSNSEEYVYVNLNELDPVTLRERFKGTENTLVEYVQSGFENGTLNLYGKNGKVVARDIPAFVKEEQKDIFFGDTEERMFSASRLCFVNVDGQLLLEVKYNQKSEIYELRDARQL